MGLDRIRLEWAREGLRRCGGDRVAVKAGGGTEGVRFVGWGACRLRSGPLGGELDHYSPQQYQDITMEPDRWIMALQRLQTWIWNRVDLDLSPTTHPHSLTSVKQSTGEQRIPKERKGEQRRATKKNGQQTKAHVEQQ